LLVAVLDWKVPLGKNKKHKKVHAVITTKRKEEKEKKKRGNKTREV